MPAQFLKFGEPPPTLGGDFERHVMRRLCEALPEDYLVIGNPSLPTLKSNFYEYDIVLATIDFCDVLEAKYFLGKVNVQENCILCGDGFSADRVFSILDDKARVLASRIAKPPFARDDARASSRLTAPAQQRGAAQRSSADVRVNSRVILPDACDVRFDQELHRVNYKAMKLSDAIAYYTSLARRSGSNSAIAAMRNGWHCYRNEWTSPGEQRTKNRLGRFYIKRALGSPANTREYLGVDEPPCMVEVHLKEFLYDPLLTPAEIQEYLAAVSREMQTLRRIRHPYVACVIGHFQTGASLVQVSDWFDGPSIDDCWTKMASLSLEDKLTMMIQIAQAISYCHSKGVFHRNILAGNVLVSGEFDEIRIRGFEFAKNLEFTKTLSDLDKQRRDPRSIPPEEWLNKPIAPRAYDVYQTGLLFYRILENGGWPFENGLDYATGNGKLLGMVGHPDSSHIEPIRQLVMQMLCTDPFGRPDPMSRVEGTLSLIAGGEEAISK